MGEPVRERLDPAEMIAEAAVYIPEWKKRKRPPTPAALAKRSEFEATLLAAHEEQAAARKQAVFPSGAGTIYFVGFGPYVKIGWSSNVASRLATLQTAMPEKLTVYHTTPGKIADERAIHKRFAAQRLEGEWFRIEGDLADFIKEKTQ